MKRSRDSATLLAAFRNVRILHYAVANPVSAPWLLEKLRGHACSLPAPALNQTLSRMARIGWLRSSPRAPRIYSLTPKGRAALNVSRTRLNDLARVLHLE